MTGFYCCKSFGVALTQSQKHIQYLRNSHSKLHIKICALLSLCANPKSSGGRGEGAGEGRGREGEGPRTRRGKCLAHPCKDLRSPNILLLSNSRTAPSPPLPSEPAEYRATVRARQLHNCTTARTHTHTGHGATTNRTAAAGQLPCENARRGHSAPAFLGQVCQQRRRAGQKQQCRRTAATASTLVRLECCATRHGVLE